MFELQFLSPDMILCTNSNGTNVSVFITEVEVCFLYVGMTEVLMCLCASRMAYFFLNELLNHIYNLNLLLKPYL